MSWGENNDTGNGWGDTDDNWGTPAASESKTNDEAKGETGFPQKKSQNNDDGWGSSGCDWGTKSEQTNNYGEKRDWGSARKRDGNNFNRRRGHDNNSNDWGSSKHGENRNSSGSNWGSSNGGDRNFNSPNKGFRGPPRKREQDNNSDNWGASSGDGGNSGGDWGASNDKDNAGGNWGNSNDDHDTDRGHPRKRGQDYDSSEKKRYRKEDGSAGAGGLDEDRPAPFKPEEINLEQETKLQVSDVGENFYNQKEIKVTCMPKDLVTPIDNFDDLIESKLLLSNIKSLKYSEMSPIQKWAIPAITKGLDMIACAQTGSGKTAAFLLPVLQTLIKTELESNDLNDTCRHPYCLIISPTRELAHQIHLQSLLLSKDSIIKSVVIYGQVSSMHLRSKLSSGCHILVATPGKLKDFVERGWIGFKNIKYIILDEGDRLVGDGFKESIDYFLNHPTMSPRDTRQILFFSATFNKDIQLIATNYLENFVILTVGKIGAANEDIKQEFLQVVREDKKRELKKILEQVPEDEKTIVFTQTKTAADMLAGFFNVLKLSSTSIHGDRHQSQREEAIRLFKRGDKRFLISSPVGNRGLDLPKVSLVINYDLPREIDEYVHRIGRTGRAGHTGRAISFYDESRDAELLKDLIPILQEAKQEIPEWMNNSSVGGTADNNDGDMAQTDGQDSNWDADAASAPVTAPAEEEEVW